MIQTRITYPFRSIIESRCKIDVHPNADVGQDSDSDPDPDLNPDVDIDVDVDVDVDSAANHRCRSSPPQTPSTGLYTIAAQPGLTW